ncbi:MAG: DUF3810 domain-containing protein [Lachnospiraceae bacterium]|nr:DUF3810 domain-containing protein [Lachnospiraceae bacterium]
MKKYGIIGSIWIIIIFVNVLAWNSTVFCDWYIANIFPLWVGAYGRLTSLFTFSVGEIMLIIAVVLLVLLLFIGVSAGICKMVYLAKGNYKKKLPLWIRRYCMGVLIIFTCVGVIMTSNCFILYHGSTFSEKYMEKTLDKKYRLSELTELRNHVVSECNRLSKLVERDENGNVIYSGELEEQALKEMKRLGEVYPQLGGFYPNPKGFTFSGFFSQQKMMGYYFPFSMEANYNTKMYVTNMPSTICHELSHVKGFIQEDEANFISYLACIDSEDIFFQYSGYLSVLYYVDNDYYEAIDENKAIYKSQVRISSQVRKDKVFLTPEAWKEVEKKAVVSTKTVSKVSEKIVETNLTLNGVTDGTVSYSRVVELLLEYYDDERQGY